jgi:hypothetical protein
MTPDEISKLHNGKPHKWYVFTINNYTSTDVEQLNNLLPDVTYLTYGYEIGKETGTPHLQGYLEFGKNGQRWTWLKKRLPRAYIAQKKGSRTQARDYCFKECSNPFEYGKWIPDKQGMRNDLMCMKRKIDNGATEAQIADEHFGSWTRSYRAMERYAILKKRRTFTNPPPARRDLKVYWHYGPAGSGKTYAAFEKYPDLYRAFNGKWFDGYMSHETVLFDDLRPDTMSWNYLLSILDVYRMRVETKGGSVWFVPSTIIITAPSHPNTMFSHVREDISQLTRRITEIKHFEKRSGGVNITPDTS